MNVYKFLIPPPVLVFFGDSFGNTNFVLLVDLAVMPGFLIPFDGVISFFYGFCFAAAAVGDLDIGDLVIGDLVIGAFVVANIVGLFRSGEKAFLARAFREEDSNLVDGPPSKEGLSDFDSSLTDAFYGFITSNSVRLEAISEAKYISFEPK